MKKRAAVWGLVLALHELAMGLVMFWGIYWEHSFVALRVLGVIFMAYQLLSFVAERDARREREGREVCDCGDPRCIFTLAWNEGAQTTHDKRFVICKATDFDRMIATLEKLASYLPETNAPPS